LFTDESKNLTTPETKTIAAKAAIEWITVTITETAISSYKENKK
jgi:hypothetical protein